MAGSKKYWLYTDDFGETWAMEADESNMEGWLLDAAPYDVTISNVGAHPYKTPSNLKRRTARFRDPDGRIRTAYPPTRALVQALVENDNSLVSRSFSSSETGTTFTFIGFTNERIAPIVVDADTGLNDGDAD